MKAKQQEKRQAIEGFMEFTHDLGWAADRKLRERGPCAGYKYENGDMELTQIPGAKKGGMDIVQCIDKDRLIIIWWDNSDDKANSFGGGTLERLPDLGDREAFGGDYAGAGTAGRVYMILNK